MKLSEIPTEEILRDRQDAQMDIAVCIDAISV